MAIAPGKIVLKTALKKSYVVKFSTTVKTTDLIADQQHGFIPGRSFSTALLSASTQWLQSLDARVPVDVVSLDFSRSHDTISHNILVKKLQLCYNFKGAALDWIESFVTNRLQRVVYKGFTSDWLPVGSGVPQGSVHGPLLIVLYANDLQYQIPSILVQNADDTCLFKK